MAKKRRTKKQKAATRKMIAANRKGKRKARKTKRRRKTAVAPTPTNTAPKKRRRRRKAKAAAPKRRRRRAKRRSRRRSSRRRGGGRRSVKTIRQRVVSVPKAGTQSVRIDLSASRGKKRRRKSRRKNPETSLVRAGNPGAGTGLLGNAGPFTKDALMGYVSMALGTGIGVIGADFADRFVSSMKPKDGNHPWYGRNAAAAYQRRPDALRLGVQAGGAVTFMALTYFARNIKILPWLTGGLSIGFGVNLLQMLSRWYLMPAVLKADSGEVNLGNRLYPMEQGYVQDEVEKFFESYTTVIDLAAGQAGTEPVAPSPINIPLSVYALGAKGHSDRDDQVGRSGGSRRTIQTGRLGGCASCGGGDGVCYSDCPNMCQDCIANGDGTATYTVEPGDAAYPAMVTTAGVNAAIVSGLNGGRHWQEFWRVGSRVQVPYHFAVYLQGVSKHRAALGNVPVAPPPSPIQHVMATPPAPATMADDGTPASMPSAFALNNDAE